MLHGFEDVRYRKMFGEYMVYLHEKPALLVCDDNAYCNLTPDRFSPALKEKLCGLEVGCPYPGAKAHVILDMADADFLREIAALLEQTASKPQKPAR